MSVISILISKVLGLFGIAFETTGNTSHILFAGIAIYTVITGLLTIRNGKPHGAGTYKGYTEASVNAASPLLGIGNILMGFLFAAIGAVPANALPLPLLCVIIGLLLAGYITVTTFFYKKLEKI